MASLIYDNNDMFPFELQYSFVEHPNGLCIIDTPKEGNTHTLKYLAHGPSFDIVASALEEATYINHITGSPFVRTSILYRTIFPLAIINVEFPGNDKLNSIDVVNMNISQINYNLIRMICKQWLKDTL